MVIVPSNRLYSWALTATTPKCKGVSAISVKNNINTKYWGQTFIFIFVHIQYMKLYYYYYTLYLWSVMFHVHRSLCNSFTEVSQLYQVNIRLFSIFSKIILLQVGRILFSVSALKGCDWYFSGNALGMFWWRNKVSCTVMCVYVCLHAFTDSLTCLSFLRLYTCMLTLQLSKQLDVCTVSTAIAGLWKDSTKISSDGPLSRIGECWTVCTGITQLQLIQVV